MKKSAFGIDYYPTETTPNQAPELDARTKYELLHCDFIQENFSKHPAMHVVRANKLANLLDETFMDYCLLITSNIYTIVAIKTKIDSLPDNNNLIPATYKCAILNKQSKVIDRFGQISSKKIYDMFATGKFK